MPVRLAVALIALVPFVGGSETATAQNLLSNGTFDQNIAGWSPIFVPSSQAWSTQDAHGSTASGSLKITTDNSNFEGQAFQTINAAPHATYIVTGDLYPHTSPGGSGNTVYIDFLDTQGAFIGLPAMMTSQTQSTWVHRTATVTAPAGTAALRIRLDVYGNSATDFGLFDNMTVVASPPVVSFAANPTSIAAGQTSTLTWTTTDASAVLIDHGIGTKPVNGSQQVQPAETTTYMLTATGPGGTRTATVTVTVVPAPTIVFTATPPTTLPGGNVKLEWQVFDATLVTLDPDLGVQPLFGSVTVSPKATTTYTLTATGVGGTRAVPLTVSVGGKRRAVRH